VDKALRLTGYYSPVKLPANTAIIQQQQGRKGKCKD
jgi:hypothetical protein